jgi:acyl-CoA thioesterase I
MISRWGGLGLLVLAAAACDRTPAPPAGGSPSAESPGVEADPRGRVVFLGTSLTAGLGLDPAQAYPALLQRKIDSAGLPLAVVNAGVSGETSAGARRRIDWLLPEPAAVLVIETGANDALRGLDVDSLVANIQAIIDRARQQVPPPEIVLVGMQAPPNLGPDYVRRFDAAYATLARRNRVALVPFLLEGVAGVDSLNQADAIHPTAAGQRKLAETVWPAVRRAGGRTVGRSDQVQEAPRPPDRLFPQHLPQRPHRRIDLGRRVVVMR